MKVEILTENNIKMIMNLMFRKNNAAFLQIIEKLKRRIEKLEDNTTFRTSERRFKKK